MTIVEVDGLLTAVQSPSGGSQGVGWVHTDPLVLSMAGDTKPVYDPQGNYIPWQTAPTAPPNSYPPFSPGYNGLGSAFGSSQDNSCALDGTPTSCDKVLGAINAGLGKALLVASRENAHVVLLKLGLVVTEGPLHNDSTLWGVWAILPARDPQNSAQTKPPCPPVPDAPAGANIDDNIRAAAASIKDALEPKWYAGPDSGEDPLGKLAGHALWFYNQVKDKGAWDYKYRDPAISEGKRSKYEPLGNFNYGAAGAAAGFSEGQLLRMAGHFQTDKTYAEGENPGMVRSILGVGGRTPYGDEPGDYEQIRSGINYYRRKFVLQDCQ